MRTIRIPSLPKISQSKGRGRLVLVPSHKRKSRTVNTKTDWTNLGGDVLTSRKLLVVLPLPPSINHQYATVNGRRVLASKGRHYKVAVAQHLLPILRQSPHHEKFLEQLRTHTLILSLRFYFKSSLRRDLDGGLKIAQDSICQAIGLNDNRITEIRLFKDLDATRPRMECTLRIQNPIPRPTRSTKGLTIVKTAYRGSSSGPPSTKRFRLKLSHLNDF